MSEKIKILIPIYNDWESLYILMNQINVCVAEATLKRFSFVIVNDCSLCNYDSSKIPQQFDIQIVHLNRNLGHQKAIAIGLAYLHTSHDFGQVVIMDSDGEDRPEDIEKIIAMAERHQGNIVFASRLKRYEGITFRFFYQIYKIVFRIMTGKTIAFGNFCVIPAQFIEKLAYVSEIWNHFSGGVIRSKLPYITLPLDRGKRLAGKSKMNFTSLILHGLGAVSVHLDVVAVRLLLFCIGIIMVAVLGISAFFVYHFLTNCPISDLVSRIVMTLMIIFVQAFLVCMFLVFMVLTYRTHIHFIPAIGYKDFILRIEQLSKASK